MTDDPTDPGIWDVWLGKFESALRRLYWWSALVHIETEFGPPRAYEWLPPGVAVGKLYDDPPQPVATWVRTTRHDRGQQSPSIEGIP